MVGAGPGRGGKGMVARGTSGARASRFKASAGPREHPRPRPRLQLLDSGGVRPVGDARSGTPGRERPVKYALSGAPGEVRRVGTARPGLSAVN
jgi:hypothetical protein